MELKSHFRVVRFSPVPEVLEPINVALLIFDRSPRLVTDYEFEKLGCVAPSFDRSTLQVWLEIIADDIRRVPPQDIPSWLTSRTAQIQLGKPCFLGREVSKDLEDRLIREYLKKPHRHTERGEPRVHYVDSLISDVIGKADWIYGEVMKRAKPEQFLRNESLSILHARSIRFSRVLLAPKSIVLMDGLNLAITNRNKLRQRATDIGFGFFSFGEVKKEIQSIEQRELVRTSFIFNRRPDSDREIDYLVETVRRDADFCVDNQNPDEVRGFNQVLRAKSI